ncbi:hypothetical protein B0H99_105232 [Planomicrobium soli]|uniref:Uncharacterized protein n=1 Tax=Planomicrobium soli TaxID=1176648 RepID=A0A2P8H2L8_9BACL|nr:hypothetical protein [Planomicrobium soli]PSL40454.1 hypothetical protein B0H99_105232 [Planomicrobium soli]
MKGFLSLLGITLIVSAFGLILMIFIGNPLEEWKSDERMYAYIEMRQHHSAEIATQSEFALKPIVASAYEITNFYINLDSSCERPFRD